MYQWAISAWWIFRLTSALAIGRGYAEQRPRVTLPSGATVIGWNLTTPDGDVLAYTNLRYAITLSRFGAPLVYTAAPSEVIDGTVRNEPCIQKGGVKGVYGVEDCLTLAVFVPPGPSLRKRPVLVFVHGGFLISGEIPMGDLNYIGLQADAVVVAINYRLNVFGFLQPPVPEIVPANRGLRDQIAALQWIQQNIGSFSGDASKVTLWGQSAGGRSVVALYQSPMAVGLFHRAIAMSPGYVPGMFQSNLSMVKETLGVWCMQATGCTTLRCLEDMDAFQLAKKCMFYLEAADFVNVPNVYFSGYDGEVLLEPVRQPLCALSSVPNGHIPIILGAMAHEFRAFTLDTPATGYLERFFQDSLPPTWREQQRSCLRSTSTNLFEGAQCPSNVKICSRLKDVRLVQEATQVYSLGLEFAGRGPGPRYRYLMDTDALGGWCGACHGGDLDLVMGRSDVDSSFPKDELQSFRALFTGYLASFVKSGIPIAPIAPTAPIGAGVAWSSDGPVMEFNLSKANHAFLSPLVYYSDEAQQEMIRTLCHQQSTSCCAKLTC